MKACVAIKFVSEAQAKHIFKAVVPDNYELPPGLSIDSKLDGNMISFEIQSNRGLESLGATLEDLMSAIDLSIRTTEAIPK